LHQFSCNVFYDRLGEKSVYLSTKIYSSVKVVNQVLAFSLCLSWARLSVHFITLQTLFSYASFTIKSKGESCKIQQLV